MKADILLGFEVGFLIGLIEGEGCIKHFRHSSRHGQYKTPSLSISNSDLDLLQYATQILHGLGIHSNIYKVHSAGDGEGTKHSHLKNTYELRVVGYKNFTLLKPILEKLISEHRKRQLAEVLTLVQMRQERLNKLNERNQFILSEVKKGETIPRIAGQLNLKSRYLYEWLRRRGLNVSKVRAS